MQPISSLPPTALLNSGEVEIDLPRDVVYKTLLLNFLLNYDVGVAAATVHEDGIAQMFERISVEASGIPSLVRANGYTLAQQAAFEQGGPLRIDEITGTVAAGKLARLSLPINFISPHASNPLVTLFDPRGLAEFKLRIKTRALSAVLAAGGGGSVTFNSLSVVPVVHGLVTSGQIAGKVMERRLVELTKTEAAINDKSDIDIRQGGAIRQFLVITRTAAPTAGARTDAGVNTVTVKRNSAEYPWQEIPFRAGQAFSRLFRDYEAPTGVAVFSTDPEGVLAQENLLYTDDPETKSLNFREDVLVAGTHTTLLPEIVTVRGR